MNRNVWVLIALAVVIAVMILGGQHLARQSGQPGLSGSVRGKVAPDFQLKDVAGNNFRLSELRGKAVVLNFWATWCPPCKEEIPWFVDLQNQYGPQGLQIVGVSMDDAKPEAIAQFAANMHMNYPVLLGTDKVADLYGGVEALPTTFYIGRDGKVTKAVFGLAPHREVVDNIRAALERGEPGVAESQPGR